MNKYHLDEIINILVMPLTQEEFIVNDYISNYNEAYIEVDNCPNDNYFKREEAEKKYQKTEKQLQKKIN